jgi:RNA recognition motif-containing protein
MGEGAKLFVDGLPSSFGHQQLHDLFAAYGEVLFVQVVQSRTGANSGFGYVEMASRSEAEQAASALNRSDLQGRVLLVFLSKNRSM